MAAVPAMLASGAMVAPPAYAAEQIEEVVVTATKRNASVQDIALSIQVLGGQQLEDLGISNMEDYVQMLAPVNYVSLGPGSGNIYIRGISSGGESLLGATPNVAIYLDEQPVTAVGAYMNPHIYDVNRVEVLAGPQGTLFGANSQSGSIRIITNQPNPGGFEAGFDVEGSTVNEGEFGSLIEGFVNLPISDTAAVRLVGWRKDEGGYIDNVPATHTFDNSRIRAGLDPATQSDLIAKAADITIDNSEFVEEDFNDALTIGGRAALKVDLNENWTVTAGYMRQELDRQGVWDHDPTDVGDLQVARFQPDTVNDEWDQLSLVVEGRLPAGMSLTYAGATLDRKAETDADYSLYTDPYLSPGFVQAYYQCYVAYFGECVDPRILFENHESWGRDNHELRLASDGSQRFRWLLGMFYEEGFHEFDLEWHVLGLTDIPSTFNENGWATSGPAIDEPDIYWTTDQKRSNEEFAFFGELEYDFTEDLTASVSARRFDYESTLVGFSGTIWFPTCCWQRSEANNDLLTEDSDTVVKVNVSYDVNDQVMVYYSYAEGYRPGGLNRLPTSEFGASYEPDFVESNEIGLKGTFLNSRLQLNLAAYTQTWDDFQLSRIDPSVSVLTLTDNLGNAESNGIEGDIRYLINGNWDVTFAFSFIDAKLTDDYWVRESDRIAGNPPNAPSGRELPRVPEVKWNVTSRYNFDVAGYRAFLQGAFVHTGESWNSLVQTAAVRAREIQDDYQILNVSAGMNIDSWQVELFARNLTDERGEVFKNGATYDFRVTTNQPRTFGVRVRQRF